MRAKEIGTVHIGGRLTVDDVAAVARHKARVEFTQEYEDRVVACRKLVDKFSNEERVVYGITTGLGDNVDKYVGREERAAFQRNTVLSHAASVGEPHNEECVRAIMLVLIQHLGSGYTGIRLETVETLRQLLNAGVVPYAPSHGSVGYLGVEAHVALTLIGEGRAWYGGELLDGAAALRRAGIQPVVLEAKEGLSLVSGTTSTTALASLAVYDAVSLAKTADVSGSMSLEVLKGTVKAMDKRLMDVRPHPNQGATAANIRNILRDSEIQKKYDDHRVQDALSLRCMPQLHGAAKKLIRDSLETIETELNSSVDNPLLFETQDGAGIALMGCNADGAYAGTASDAICIGIANLAKIAERRLDRLVNHHVSELPPFLSSSPGVNNGFMIPQYTASGIMGELRLKAHPATVDNVPTCALQEDYVSMGYNAAYKAYSCADLAKYIFAIEIMCATQAQDFFESLKPSSATAAVRRIVREKAPFVDLDRNMHGDMEYIAGLVRDGGIVDAVESQIGPLLF
ncbi:MAG: aromatic amino acid ammonia-lyase [Synergistaceae bacterium]|jgi:histidine ammonia-lyase|nr:aromatic amino acid ammonia-lyase [Synergistaceae bacterium]